MGSELLSISHQGSVENGCPLKEHIAEWICHEHLGEDNSLKLKPMSWKVTLLKMKWRFFLKAWWIYMKCTLFTSCDKGGAWHVSRKETCVWIRGWNRENIGGHGGLVVIAGTRYSHEPRLYFYFYLIQLSLWTTDRRFGVAHRPTCSTDMSYLSRP